MKCDVIDGSVVIGIREPIPFIFILDKPSGYKAFCQTETVHYKKKSKKNLNAITFYLENVKTEEVNFNGETFTQQMVKI